MYSNACSAVGFGAVFLFAEDAELFLADVFFVLDLAAEVFFCRHKEYSPPKNNTPMSFQIRRSRLSDLKPTV